jgi:predicted 2-oxoglutarate/Fe(II)-dependent dioxygenase YbiX
MNICKNLLSDKELFFLNSICSNFVETQLPHNRNNYVRKNLNIKEELLEYQKRCSKYLPDGYQLYDLWINKVTNKTNIDDNYHIDVADLSIITYINENFEGGEFQYIFKNEEIKVKPIINHSLIINKEIEHRVLNVTNGERFSLISFYKKIQKKQKTLI